MRTALAERPITWDQVPEGQLDYWTAAVPPPASVPSGPVRSLGDTLFA